MLAFMQSHDYPLEMGRTFYAETTIKLNQSNHLRLVILAVADLPHLSITLSAEEEE